MTAGKRPWFQYHLSTAIVLMFVAAGLLWLNIGLHEHEFYGWPFHVYSYDFTWYDEALGGYHWTPTEDNVAWLVVDIVVALSLLAAMMIACEEDVAEPGKMRYEPRPAVFIAEFCCLAACVLWNLLFPLSHYFRENLGGPLVERVLSWLFLTFSVAYICEWWCRLSGAWKRNILIFLLSVFFLGVLMLPILSQQRGSGSSPRRYALSAIEIGLYAYKQDEGSYPPDERPAKSSGQTLYNYLCQPILPSGKALLRAPPPCVYVRPDGTKELRGPLGQRYIYRLVPNDKTGVLQPVVEEIDTLGPPRK